MAPDPRTLMIRRAGPADLPALERLSQLDSGPRMTDDTLVAEVDGEMHAALRLRDGVVIADPFSPTEDLVELLAVRGRLIRGEHRSRHHGSGEHTQPQRGRSYLLSSR